MKTIIPPYLKPGDTIGITCPAGFMAVDKALTCINTLQAWGYRVQSGNLLGGRSQNYFSGSDDERIDELQMMLDDPNIKAIMFARGGYGMGRIIDYLSFKKFRKHPKWLIGFSDITVIQMHIFAQYNIASLHAPMAAAFNDGEEDNEYIRSLRYALEGKPAHYTFPTHAFNKAGTATGKLVGGNLALVAHLIGTSSEVDTENKILFLEDIGEYLYNADRMLYQLKRAGLFDGLAGLVLGGFTDMKDTERPFGKTMDEILREVLQEFDFPVCYHFPVSHGKENYALKVGVKYELTVGKHDCTLSEIVKGGKKMDHLRSSESMT